MISKTYEISKKKIESETESSEENDLDIPDGGWGWVVCFAGFMINFIIPGFAGVSGVVLLGLLELFNDTLSKTSLVISIFMGTGMVSAPLALLLIMFNASHRQIIMLGGFLAALSTIASWFADRVEVLYATYGLFTSISLVISYITSNIIVGAYFKKKRALAVGIASSGAGFGAFVLNYLIERSISFYGMRGTFLIVSGLFLNVMVFGALCRPLKSKNEKEINLKSVKAVRTETNLGFEPEEKNTVNKEEARTNLPDDCGPDLVARSTNRPATSTKNQFITKCCYVRLAIFDLEVLTNPGMQLLLTVYTFWSVGEIILIYVPTKAVSAGLSREEGALIMSIYGIVFALSEILAGVLADVFHIPISFLLMFSLVGMVAGSVAFTFCNSFLTFVLCTSLFAICMGFTTALRVVLVAAILGVNNLFKGYSPLFVAIGITYLIFSFITGALFDTTQSLNTLFFFCSAALSIACIASVGMIYMQRTNKFKE